MDDATLQTAGLLLGLVLTLMIYSYLLGDNPLYRLAVHIMVGVGMGYAMVVIAYTVIVPQLITPLQQSLDGTATDITTRAQVLVVVLAVFLLLKLSRQTAPLGNLAMAFAIGVGAAVAVGGAVFGTLLPQVGATALPLLPDTALPIVADKGDILNVLAALVLITGTITSLLYFHFDARPLSEDKVERPGWVRLCAQIGQVFLMTAFGSLFAGSIIASLSILTHRISFYSEGILGLLGFE